MVIMVDAEGIVLLYNIVGFVLLDFAPDLLILNVFKKPSPRISINLYFL